MKGSFDETVRLWQVNSGSLLWSVRGHDYRVNAVAFSPDGTTIASCIVFLYLGSDDNSVKLWNAVDGSLACKMIGHEGNANSIAFASDGLTLVSGWS